LLRRFDRENLAATEVGESMNKQERLKNRLYYLGKAVWKSVPVIGPAVDVLIYEQFKDDLLAKVNENLVKLHPDQVDQLLAALPSQEQLSEFEANLTDMHWEQRVQAARNFTSIMGAVAEGFSGMNGRFSRVEDLLIELGDAQASDSLLEEKLTELERKRVRWLGRISTSQVELLSLIPHAPIEVGALWQRAKAVIPECGRIEFRFRLHELEWLELVARKKGGEPGADWWYWRVLEGRPPGDDTINPRQTEPVLPGAPP
jgi:hypothetical protein